MINDNLVTINIELTVSGRPMKLELPVPAGPSSAYAMLPVFRSLSDSFVQLAIENAEEDGKSISCCKGCGACCRQLVPISKVEARRLRDLVESMPVERRAVIERRFDDARVQLEQSGMLDRLQNPDESNREARVALGVDYFREGIACPFLEDESCSIHPERPIACREYLVTSPAINCATPTPETIDCVEVTGKVSNALSALVQDSQNDSVGWVPLTLAIDWANANPAASSSKPGPNILRELFDNLTG